MTIEEAVTEYDKQLENIAAILNNSDPELEETERLWWFYRTVLQIRYLHQGNLLVSVN